MVMNKAQKLLFLHHKRRSVDANGKSSDDDNSKGKLFDTTRLETDPYDLQKRKEQIVDILG